MHPGHVAARPVEVWNQSCLYRIVPGGKNNRDYRGCCLGRARGRWPTRCDDGDPLADEIGSHRLQPIVLTVRPTILDRDVLGLEETRLAKASAVGGQATRKRWRRSAIEKTDYRHCGLLRPCRNRPRHRCAAEQCDELAAFHSITSSASASSMGGRSSPSAFADLRLITSSNLLAWITGRSAGFSPRRIRPV